ncbi:unnamed protein product [Darwinula stevensoni]|uniref:Hikeshi-like domain-containing protein n=1 Tax=Darwinula stevensoni TaxID=69355 RepID=A0A7R9A652_9CRUS|nr:unnamed protein product [Darwinula stevensoni]CAG0895943.1 unnamed protein product [Darwinula stevensoni]
MAGSMFGVLASGRLASTEFQQMDETHFLCTIPDADNINHVVVFLTGTQPFPDGLGGSVYFSWPDPNSPPQWMRLGHISNDKPSAIFKISKMKPNETTVGPLGFGQTASHTAQIGIAVETLDVIRNSSSIGDPSNMSSYMEFTQKMIESFLNYIMSYAVNQSQMVPNPAETFVPLSQVQNWYQNFERRLQQNPYFWRN